MRAHSVTAHSLSAHIAAMKKSSRGLKVSPWLTLFIGYVLGYILYPVLQMWTCHCDTYANADFSMEALRAFETGGTGATPISRKEFIPRYLHPPESWIHPQKLGRPKKLSGEYQVRKKLLVAVITAEKYLPTRARAVYETWGGSVTEIMFFVGADCNTSHPDVKRLPIVKLPGIPDNVYPPQKKVFAVLHYIHDHYLGDFQWFMRADDDVYVRGERLENLLATFDPNEKVYLGLAGEGKTEDVDRLGLSKHERYCMGGPGVIFSNTALRELAPYLDLCLSAVDEYNQEHPSNPWYNEDVELGRCVSRSINTQCSTSAEGRSYFIQDYTSAALHPQTLWHSPTLRDLITLHPIKQPENLYAVHHFYEVMQARKVQNELKNIQSHINSMCSRIPANLAPPWKVCNVQLCSGGWSPVGVATYSTPFTVATALPKVYNPKSVYELTPWEHFSTSTMHSITGLSPEHGLYSAFQSEIAGVVSLVEYRVNAAQQTATELHPVEVVQGYTRFSEEIGREYILDVKFRTGDGSSAHTKRVRLIRPLSPHITMIAEESNTLSTVVNIILPIFEADGPLFRFMEWFVSSTAKENTHLILCVVGDTKTLYTAQTAVANYTKSHRGIRATILSGISDLSPSGALELGVSVLSDQDLVFMADTSLRIRPLFYQSCRQNTLQGKRVYFPIPYVMVTEPNHSPGPGRWGYYSYSSLCVFKSDFMVISDAPKPLFEHVIQSSSLELFQAPEPSLIKVSDVETCKGYGYIGRQLYCKDMLASSRFDAEMVEYLHEHDSVNHKSLSFEESA